MEFPLFKAKELFFLSIINSLVKCLSCICRVPTVTAQIYFVKTTCLTPIVTNIRCVYNLKEGLKTICPFLIPLERCNVLNVILRHLDGLCHIHDQGNMLPSESLNFLDGSPDLKCAVACLYDADCKYWTRHKHNQEDCYLLNNLNIGNDRFSNTNYNSGNKLCAHGRRAGRNQTVLLLIFSWEPAL